MRMNHAIRALSSAGLSMGAPTAGSPKSKNTETFEDEWDKNFPAQVTSNSVKAQRRKERKAEKLAKRR